jgi:heme O synthase-like polyprenyltransferase
MVGWLCAVILAVSIAAYYAVVYTIWLKPRTAEHRDRRRGGAFRR